MTARRRSLARAAPAESRVLPSSPKLTSSSRLRRSLLLRTKSATACAASSSLSMGSGTGASRSAGSTGAARGGEQTYDAISQVFLLVRNTKGATGVEASSPNTCETDSRMPSLGLTESFPVPQSNLTTRDLPHHPESAHHGASASESASATSFL